jgi:hypothetical protein
MNSAQSKGLSNKLLEAIKMKLHAEASQALLTGLINRIRCMEQ